jgi:SAM-dependent methyltransferase
VFFATLPLTLAEGEPAGFFSQRSLDTSLPEANATFWMALIGHIQDDGVSAPSVILDVGCHTGGLLARLIDGLRPDRVIGIEPVSALRAEAAVRLSPYPADVGLAGLAGWDEIAPGSIDLMTCHEVLYLVPDLPGFIARTALVLAPGASAYVVLGCHAENPTWRDWKPVMEASGIQTYDRTPFEILSEAANAGLSAVVQPLRRTGWISYDPRQADFRYADVASMFDHHYRHKLLFRFTRP